MNWLLVQLKLAVRDYLMKNGNVVVVEVCSFSIVIEHLWVSMYEFSQFGIGIGDPNFGMKEASHFSVQTSTRSMLLNSYVEQIM